MFGGPKVATVGKFERGRETSFPKRTQIQMERALAWPADTISEFVRRVDTGFYVEGWEEQLVSENLPDRAGRIEYYRAIADELDADGLSDDLTVHVNGLRTILKLIPEDHRGDATQEAATAMLRFWKTLDDPADDIVRSVSDPPVTPDLAIAADEQGDIAGEQESYNET